MKGAFFYNRKLTGDTLVILLSNDKEITNVSSKEEITLNFNNDKLVSIYINDISNIIKLKSEGRIMLPPNEMIDIINAKIAKFNIGKFDYITNSGFKVGKILTCVACPKSDHLHLLTVDVGNEVLNIVCGAKNVETNLLVVVATIGTILNDGSEIKPCKLMGHESFGMCCSPRELDLNIEYPERHLLILDENEVEIGQDFFLLEKK